jgi:hypothetical protein
MKIPYGVRNEELWRKHCRKIRARALDLLEGRLGVIETARLMLTLAYWTKVGNEPAFLLFRAIASATDDLPVGTVRAYWAADALAREDARIEAAEKLWREQALAAAEMLVNQYQWTIARKRSSPDEERDRPRSGQRPPP